MAQSRSKQSAETSQIIEDLPQILVQWKQAVESGDPAEVVGLYHPFASLKGTMSGRIAGSSAANDNAGRDNITIADYFNEFMAGKCNPTVEFNTLNIAPTDDETYMGEYTFRWETEEGTTKELPANYTFVARYGWISAHHSSVQAIPEDP